MDVLQLLSAAQSAQGIASDYALAARLGITRSALSSYRTGRTKPDDAMAAKLAGLAGLDAGEVVASIHAERASDPAARSLWESIAARLRASSSAAAAVILSSVITWHPDAQARASVDENTPVLSQPLTRQVIHWRGFKGPGGRAARH